MKISKIFLIATIPFLLTGCGTNLSEKEQRFNQFTEYYEQYVKDYNEKSYFFTKFRVYHGPEETSWSTSMQYTYFFTSGDKNNFKGVYYQQENTRNEKLILANGEWNNQSTATYKVSSGYYVSTDEYNFDLEGTHGEYGSTYIYVKDTLSNIENVSKDTISDLEGDMNEITFDSVYGVKFRVSFRGEYVDEIMVYYYTSLGGTTNLEGFAINALESFKLTDDFTYIPNMFDRPFTNVA